MVFGRSEIKTSGIQKRSEFFVRMRFIKRKKKEKDPL
jgi:hypothetical protein